jgi:hypothetical protein
VDVLALSGERPTSEDELIWPADFLEDGWDDDCAPSFSIVGRAPSVARLKQGPRVVTLAHGIVKRFKDDALILGTPGSPANEITLAYRLPASLDLRPLVGRRVRLTLEEQPKSGGSDEQTLTIRTADDRVWLIARCGAEEDATHAVGGFAVQVSLSPRDDGPLVVAAPELRHIVGTGGDARMGIGGSRYVVELESRDESGATYFIADDRLWH